MDDDKLINEMARAIHEGLGESWAYSNYSGDEWNNKSTRDMLQNAAAAALAAYHLHSGAARLDNPAH